MLDVPKSGGRMYWKHFILCVCVCVLTIFILNKMKEWVLILHFPTGEKK